MDMSYADRLNQAMALRGKSRRELAEAMGISVQAVGMVCRGQSGAFTAENNAKAAAFLRVSPDWLATEMGDISPKLGKTSTPSHTETQNVTPVDLRAKVPLISWVQAGDFQGVTDVYEPGQSDEWVDIHELSVSDNTFALRVTGDSMESHIPGARSFPEGTILIVDPNRAANAGDYVIAKDVQTQRATFKKLAHDGGRWYLKPLNPAYPTVEIDDPAVRIIGRVVEYQLRGRL